MKKQTLFTPAGGSYSFGFWSLLKQQEVGHRGGRRVHDRAADQRKLGAHARERRGAPRGVRGRDVGADAAVENVGLAARQEQVQQPDIFHDLS